MRTSLQQFTSDRGVPEWGSSIPDEKEFLSNAGWKTEHGRFFLEWYSDILVSHAECILRQAEQCLSHVGISAKVAKNLYQEYYKFEAPLFTWTAGYYCIPLRNMYTRIAVVFGCYVINLCCPDCGLEDDRVEKVLGLWFGMSMGESTRVSSTTIMAGEISMPGSESFDEVLGVRLARLYNFLHHFKTALGLSVTVKLSFNFRVSRIEDFNVAEYRKFLRSFYAGILG
ncbi:inactive beta-amylase 9-like [Rosa rugosa]|uniref:inactive beta-amylase 9-like n=1 Tax=Rosa rugosa TaxID=74645 RepID=UPI002B40526C|nr:inactive beta-amylase 9-like [Rosa rugosa]